jgi:hypothetical protein
MKLGSLESNKEIYSFIQRNITVKAWKVKPNYERFDLSIKEKPVKPSTPQTQQFCHPKIVFDELGIVMKTTKMSKTPHRENPNKNQEQ